MYQETAAQLVTHLSHPNGWWRDMAQQQLVLRQDKSVVPALRTMARSNSNQLARIHALWTLEGLGSLDAALARELMKDRDAKIRAAAIRASETLYKGGDKSFAADYRALASDAEAEVAIQAIQTLNTLKVPEAATVIRSVQASNRAAGVQHVATTILNPPANAGGGGGGGGGNQRTPAEVALLTRGAELFQETCNECHGDTGLGTPLGNGQTMAPALAGNLDVQAHPELVIRTLLHGLTGPIDGKTYPGGLMVPQRQPDEWIAAVASYIRTSLTNTATTVSPQEVARVRAATASRTTPYTHAELIAAVPRAVAVQPSWKATASHNALVLVGGTASAVGAFTLEGWTTGAPQQPGMWFQVELPAPIELAGIQFNSRGQGGGGGGGGGGGAAPAAPVFAYPRGYRVEVSTDGTTWKPVAEGEGTGSTTLISFAPTPARLVRITQTAATPNAPAWSMHLMRLYERSAAR
jgi:mono/diheme cytochrome c family protein